MKKNTVFLFFFVGMAFFLSACSEEPQAAADGDREKPVIELTVWGAEEDEALLEEIFASFQSRYAAEGVFRITYQPQSESHCKDALLGDLEGGADVFAFADDQLAALAAAGGLDPVANGDEIRNASLAAAVEAASVGGTLYAYPLTADHATMIRLVQEIKAEEEALDGQLADYESFVPEDDGAVYQTLLEDYDAFKHALVYLVCASADSKTQEAYAMANGDVSLRSAAAESGLDALSASVAAQAEAARGQRAMEGFNRQVDQLRTSMAEIASSLSSISGAVDGAVDGVTGVTGSTRVLAEDMEGITAGMETNQEIAGELRRQVDVFSNL